MYKLNSFTQDWKKYHGKGYAIQTETWTQILSLIDRISIQSIQSNYRVADSFLFTSPITCH